LTLNIILVSGKLAKARAITLGMRHLVMLGVTGFGAVFVLAALLHLFALRFVADHNFPYFRSLLLTSQQGQNEKSESDLRENLNAMAVRLGQMQAQLLRLDTLGERLARLAGFKPQELMFDQPPGRGGALSTIPGYDLSLTDFARQIDQLTRQLDERGDRLGVLDSLFTLESARKKLVPTNVPVEGGWYSSNFGWRLDPFSGQQAFHEGIDFMAEQGTPVKAAAGGVVVQAEYHPAYGNMIEIDHGNELITRYAHASRLLVRTGDVVLMGARIAEVGRTGRATGTHLHFEVRQRGVAQNPMQFLRLPG
jgi:murein DD-endopeptidase MepM/ murein hydrolase activator NlpD